MVNIDKDRIAALVNRFLAWGLPKSVASDLCVTMPAEGRSGTNLLTADEARQMIEHLLGEEPRIRIFHIERSIFVPREEPATIDAQIRAAAAAIANTRGARRGAPPIANVLDLLPQKLLHEIVEEAKTAVEAAQAVSGHGELLTCLRLATHELNAIRARDGAPQHIEWDRGQPLQTSSCTDEWWNELTERCLAAIARAEPR